MNKEHQDLEDVIKGLIQVHMPDHFAEYGIELDGEYVHFVNDYGEACITMSLAEISLRCR